MSAQCKIDPSGPQTVARVSSDDREKILADEAERLAAIKASGEVPDNCGVYHNAPARGTFRVTKAFALYPDGEHGFARKPAGYMGRNTIQRADTFTIAGAQAARAKTASPYTESQIAIGRAYRDLSEWLQSSGMKGSSLEVSHGGSGDADCFMDARLRDRKRLEVLERRIGSGVSMQVRRIRPSQRGIQRRNISDRDLVDAFCIRQQCMTDVLRAHGWAVKGTHTTALQKALAACLDRMIGPVPRGVQAARFGAVAPNIWDQMDREPLK